MEVLLSLLVTLPHTLDQLSLWPTMPQLWLLMLSMLPQLLLTPSMRQLPMPCTLPQLLPTLFTLPQLLPMPSMLPQLSRLLLQLTMSQLQLTRPRLTLMRSLPTPTPTLLQMTTQSLTSMLRSSPMEPPTLPDLTLLLFPMAGSNTSSTLPMDMMDMLPMSPMKELLFTPRNPLTRLPQLFMPPPQHMHQLQSQHTMPKSSLCFVNIY